MAKRKYKLKEIYYTLQGEGFHMGRSAVFCRFSGCNLWSGREEDRSKAICQFCDTDFWGMDGVEGGSYTAEELADKILSLWPDGGKDQHPFLVCTGGEPLLQLDNTLVDVFHAHGIEVAVETNGTIKAPIELDWICMSPKANTKIIQKSGNEVKCIVPQLGIDPKDFENMDFEHFYVQPMDCEKIRDNTNYAIAYCQTNPKWKLSIQTHKLLGIA